MKKLPTLNPFFIWEIASFADSFSLFIIVKVRLRLFGLQVDRDLCSFRFLVLRDTDDTKLCLIFYFLRIDLHTQIGRFLFCRNNNLFILDAEYDSLSWHTYSVDKDFPFFFSAAIILMSNSSTSLLLSNE
mgnify:CR=1 FL=1